MFSYISSYIFSHDTTLFSTATSQEPPWALITGSSSGIGYGIAQSLLQRGFNVILHGRDESRLDTARQQLQKSHPQRQIETIQFDATHCIDHTTHNLTTEVLEQLKPLTNNHGTSKINLRALVNNVGVGFNPDQDFEPFASNTTGKISQLVDANILLATYLTHHLLPTLRANAINSPDKRDNQASPAAGNSLIVNVCSIAEVGIPWMTLYCATKAYMTSFSKALDTELKGDKWPVDVKAVMLGDVDSPGHRVGVSWSSPSSDRMGAMVVNSVANVRGGVTLFPYWGHALAYMMCVVQPFWLLQKGMIYSLKQIMGKRKIISLSTENKEHVKKL